MPRNSTTGTYTRPNNSFSNPVLGDVIDPTDADALFDDQDTAFTDSLSRSGEGGMLADLELDAHAILVTEIITPANPAANNLKVYAKDVTGITKLATLDSSGTETVLGNLGTVTSFSSGNLAPLFTTNVANPTTTPALTFSLSNAGATTYLGSIAGGAPSYVTGGSLTKTDDTNVTMTLGGTPANALLSTGVSMTLGWTGQLSVARGGTGNNALGALTKVDDTNITLTLGGSPATALVNAASLTLGWTGTLSAIRGGTGTGSYAVGDLLYADTTTSLAKRAAVASGSVLASAGVSTAPVYTSSPTLTGTLTATAIVPSGSSPPTNGLYLPAANTLGLAALSLPVLQLTNPASAVNYWTMTGGPTGGGVQLAAAGGDANIAAYYLTKGGSNHLFGTRGSLSNIQFAVGDVASSVNYAQANGAVTGSNPFIVGNGSDTNIGFTFLAKGTGTLNFCSNSSLSNINFSVLHTTTSAVNYMQATGAAAGTSPQISAIGSDTNINFVTVAKGTGVLANAGSFANVGGATANVVIAAGGLIQKTSSQRKYKRDIQDVSIDRAIKVYDELRPIWYRANINGQRRDWGWYSALAEDVAEIDPALAIWDKDTLLIENEEGNPILDKNGNVQVLIDKNGQPVISEEAVPTLPAFDKIAMVLHVAYKSKIENLENRLRQLEGTK